MALQIFRRIDLIRAKLTRRYFSFRAPYPLEVCAARLETRAEKSHHLDVNVTLTLLNPNTYEFTLHRQAGYNLVVNVNGHLSRHSVDSTLVTGYAEIQGYTFWLLIVLGVTLVWIPIPGLLIPFGLWLLTLVARNSLVAQIRNALGN